MKVCSIDPIEAANLKALIDEVTKAQGAVAVAKFKVVEMAGTLCKVANIDPKTAVLSEDGKFFTVDDTADTPLLKQFDTLEK